MSNPTDARMKERRKRIIAAFGGAVLVVLLVIQAPKLMDAFGGSAEAAPPSTEVSPTETAAPRSPAPAAGSLAAVLAAERRVVREPGRLYAFSRFAYRDPFAAPQTASRPVAKSRRPARKPPTRRAPVRRLRYTVIVHTLPVSMSRGRAQSLARRVSRRLGRQARVLRSSDERTLRPGYWVVHVGSYRTRAGAAGTLRAALRLNRRAYIRPIIR